MKTTQIFDINSLTKAADIIRSGGLIAFPTETIYGLGADATNPVACAEIYAVKGRPSDNPLIVHVPNLAMAEEIAVVCPTARKLFNAFSPGPITIVMKCKQPSINGRDDVAIRIPKHPVAQKFLELCGVPIAAPSANISGKLSPTTADMVARDLSGYIDGIIKSDDIECGLESTVVSVLDNTVKLLRAGTISLEQIEQCQQQTIVVADAPKEGEHVLSPGQKYKHYSPPVPLVCVESLDTSLIETYKDSKIGLLCMQDYENISTNWDVRIFKNLSDYAKNLYRVMDEMGRNGCEKIIAVLPSDFGIGRAIRDRLIKGSGRTDNM